VINVSLVDAMAYVKWLSEQTKQNYRLPTEAEWEYVAKAGTKTRYWWGNDIGIHQANCWEDECGDRFKYTAPIGSFKPNSFGLYDTAGNVWEWTCSEYEDKYRGKEQQCVKVIDVKNLFVLRGGSWYNTKQRLRPTYRLSYWPHDRIKFAGFRVVREQNNFF